MTHSPPRPWRRAAEGPRRCRRCFRRSEGKRAGGLPGRRRHGFSSSSRRASDRWPGLRTPFFGAVRRAMRLDRRTVDHRERGWIGAFDQGCEDALPQPAPAPAVISIEDRRIRPKFIRKRAPSAAFTKAMDDPADYPMIILPFRAGVDHWKMRRQSAPLLVIEPKVVRHESDPP